MSHIPKPKIGQFTIEYVPGRGYFVLSPAGDRVSGPFGARNNALTNRDARQARADVKSRRGARPCLCCGAVFQSEGPHNRMCTPCRALGSDTSTYRFISPARRAG